MKKKILGTANPSEIWSEFKAGNDEAFTWIFDTYSDSLFQYGRKLVKDIFLVEDCIQELFIKLYNNRRSLSELDNLDFYLFRALKNTLIDALSKNKHIQYISPTNLPFEIEYTPTNEDDEVKEKFIAVMELVTPRQREALYLRYQKNMNYEEIALLMDMKIQSVRNLVHRSLEKIKSEMDTKVFISILLLSSN